MGFQGHREVDIRDSAVELQVSLPPGLLRPELVEAMAAAGTDVFRLRLSRLPIAALEETVTMIRSRSDAAVCIETEGPQARCGVVTAGAVLRAGATVQLTSEKVLGTERQISLRPASLFATLREGTIVRIEPDVVTRVGKVEGQGAVAVVVEGGPVESNAVVTLEPSPAMPSALTDKDRAAIAVGMRLGVDRYGLSCASSAEQVRSLRLLAPRAQITASIATGTGYDRRAEIIGASDAVLIDRRGLAQEFPPEQVPHCQRDLLTRAGLARIPAVIDVTLTRGAEGHLPSVPEAGDIAASLLDHARGLVVAPAAEPVEAVEAARRCLTAFAAQEAEVGSWLPPLAARP